MNFGTVTYFGKDINIYYPENITEAVINAITSGRIWETKLLKYYCDIIKDGDTVLDIGGYLGTHSIAFSHLVGTGMVYTFEPQPNIFKLLSKTIEESNLQNIKLYNNAVYNKNETIEFINTQTGKASIKHIRPRLKGDIIKVDAITIDSMNISNVKLVKIDVEKGEWAVLEGMHETILKYKPIIFLETFKTNNNFTKLNTFCNKYNYSFINIGGADFILK
tara:strand:+ start:99 stop:758 length:660 start_codon:yes stop_codon:yes gene_type:complete